MSLSIGNMATTRELIHKLGGYIFIIERNQTDKSVNFISNLYRRLLLAEMDGKPLFVSRGMLLFIHGIDRRLENTLRLNGVKI